MLLMENISYGLWHSDKMFQHFLIFKIILEDFLTSDLVNIVTENDVKLFKKIYADIFNFLNVFQNRNKSDSSTICWDVTSIGPLHINEVHVQTPLKMHLV